MPKGVYMTAFKGEVDLSSLTDSQIEKVANTVKNAFPGLMNLDKRGKMLYISGEHDNTGRKMQKFFSKLAPALPIESEAVIEAQGDDIKDRWDLIIKLKGVYIQEYSFVPGEVTKFEG